MGWVRIDDNFADHPKVIGLSDAAFRLFVTGLCYSNRQLTDGLIPYQIVMAWVGDNPFKPSDELEDQNLWERVEKGFLIRSYTEYQPTREKVHEKRENAKARLKKFRDKNKVPVWKESGDNDSRDFDEFERELETQMKREPQPNPSQPNPISLDIDISKEVVASSTSALNAVNRISQKLSEARAGGVNAWNLSKLVEEQWDILHNDDDINGCIALTVWYVTELQSRVMTTAEITRIGQMTKRFGRISLLAIDEAASKDLKDLPSYALRVAQRMYAEKKA